MEVLVLLFIFGVAMSALFALTGYGNKNVVLVRQTNQAISLAQEAMEATRSIRDTTTWNVDGLGMFSTGQPYHAEKASSGWQLIAGKETISGFTRQIVFGEVRRDGSDNIVPSGGILDPDTKKVTVTVFWQEKGATHDVQLVSYLTNWK